MGLGHGRHGLGLHSRAGLIVALLIIPAVTAAALDGRAEVMVALGGLGRTCGLLRSGLLATAHGFADRTIIVWQAFSFSHAWNTRCSRETRLLGGGCAVAESVY